MASSSDSSAIYHTNAETDLSCIYNDAPDDLIELIVLVFSTVDQYGHGKGGMNALRLVSKRLMRMVESCAARLTNLQGYVGPDSFPANLKKCKRIESIRCNSHNLENLRGCPDGLKSLQADGHSLESLEPLKGCTQLETLEILTAVDISDLSPLTSCTRLKALALTSSPATDLSPLSSMLMLNTLDITGCHNIKSLDPLSGLTSLWLLSCRGIKPKTSLLPLASCSNLSMLMCDDEAVDLKELHKKFPSLYLLNL